MIVDFDNIPNQGKVFVFPSSRKFYTHELTELNQYISSFLTESDLKNEGVTYAFDIRYQRFIIFAVDNTVQNLSTHFYNTLTQFIQNLEKKYNVVLLDKINVCYKQGEFVQYKELDEFKNLVKNRGVSKKTVVFNNLINTKEELEYDWEINITDSWLGRLLKK